MGPSAEQTLSHTVIAGGAMKTPQRIDLNLEQVDELLKRVQTGRLQEGDYEIIKAMVETIELLSQCVDEKATSIQRLLRMLFGPRTKNLILQNPSNSIQQIKTTSQNQKDTAETQQLTIPAQS